MTAANAMTGKTPQPWIESFRSDSAEALDRMLRGLASVPPYERSAPSEILVRLFGGEEPELGDRDRLDLALVDWLARKREEGRMATMREYGLHRFVAEYMDALATVWMLNLPKSGRWIQDNFDDLERWAAPLNLAKEFDLPTAVARAGALTQIDQRLRFYWNRFCKEAARSSKRALIDPALMGLSKLPGTKG